MPTCNVPTGRPSIRDSIMSRRSSWRCLSPNAARAAAIHMHYEHIVVPSGGRKITVNPDTSVSVPDNPIIPFIEADGIGIDVNPAMLDVVDAAVSTTYGERRRVC